MRTITIKRFKYKDKNYKFKEPLKIVFDTFLCYDLKTKKSEIYIPAINDGYSTNEVTNPDKEIKNYLTHIFDEYLMKNDDELIDSDRDYKYRFLNLLVNPNG